MQTLANYYDMARNELFNSKTVTAGDYKFAVHVPIPE